MLEITERVKNYDLTAFVALDTLEPLAERICKIIETGRPMTLVSHWINASGAEFSLEVVAGLRLARAIHHPDPNLMWRQDRDGKLYSQGFNVTCSPGITSWGFVASGDESATEDEVIRRYQDTQSLRGRRSVTRVSVDGTPQSRDTTIEIMYWNQYGVGRRTLIVFAPLPPREEVAEAEARIIDALAAARPAWTAEQLADLARDMRYNRHTVAAALADRADTARESV